MHRLWRRLGHVDKVRGGLAGHDPCRNNLCQNNGAFRGKLRSRSDLPYIRANVLPVFPLPPISSRTMTTTTVVFVPGAWITPVFYLPFLRALSTAGYGVHCASYSSLDPTDPSSADCEADAKDIGDSLRAIVEDEGKDALLVMHSYAGMPGAAAAVGLGKSQRQEQGKPGGVLGMVYIGAFVVPEGVSCAGLMGGNLPPWILLDRVCMPDFCDCRSC
jgi:hypothetical protein